MANRFFQFTLDFLGAAPEVAAREPLRRQKIPVSASNEPLARVQPKEFAIESVASSALGGAAAFRHPRATREVLMDGKLVAYEVRRRKRRSIGFSVSAEGLAVSAPQWVPLYEVDRAVHAKSGWILKKLREAHERQRKLESSRIVWQGGAQFLFMGAPVTVVLDASQLHASLHPADDANPSGRPGQLLRIKLPTDASPDQVQHAVQHWLMQQARLLFASRLDHFAPQLGVQWRQLSLSSATTRWGSATTGGAIRLNWRLMHLRPDLIDYVVVHELSHLRVMDHSPRFWATVASVMPDYAHLRRQLMAEVLPRK